MSKETLFGTRGEWMPSWHDASPFGLVVLRMAKNRHLFMTEKQKQKSYLEWSIWFTKANELRLIISSSSSSSSSWEGRVSSWSGSKLWVEIELGTAAAAAASPPPGTLFKLEVKLQLMLLRILLLFEADEALENAGCSTSEATWWCGGGCCCCELWSAFATASLLFISWLCTIASSVCRDATYKLIKFHTIIGWQQRNFFVSKSDISDVVLHQS